MPHLFLSRHPALFSIFAVLLLAACSVPLAAPAPTEAGTGVWSRSTLEGSYAPTGSPTIPDASITPTSTRQPSPAATLVQPTGTLTPLPTATPWPADWRDLPVIPNISARAHQVYQAGLAKGNNPHVFAKAGDCETITDWFLVDFDRGPRFYGLGPYQDLQPVIDYFKGSFARSSLAARRGFNAAALLTAFWADYTQCKPDETPLGCEYRLTRPSFALIMLGTNDVPHKASFEGNLRKVIQFSLDQGVLPVLVTKADNLEGDESINATIASLAQEFDLPLWNFWRAVQPLPDAGLQDDGAHLTYATNFFDDPEKMKSAWPWRNLTALQVLDAVLRGVK
jgi:hypothetical protein